MTCLNRPRTLSQSQPECQNDAENVVHAGSTSILFFIAKISLLTLAFTAFFSHSAALAIMPHNAARNGRVFLSFWLMEAVITMQFSLVITAANDLVAHRAPTGLILFAYALPSVLVRVIVPFVPLPSVRRRQSQLGVTFSTQVDYSLRFSFCAVCSFAGVQLLAWIESVPVRLAGITLAAVSSNLGDTSVNQLCARYSDASKYAFGGYTSGSGSAALIGSFVYTVSTNIFGLSTRSIIGCVGLGPIVVLAAYFFLLPAPSASGKQEVHSIARLPWRTKLRIVRPIVVPYMLPLASIYFFENITTQGVVPTILYDLPLTRRNSYIPGVLNRLLRAPRDFFPLYMTVGQLFTFAGRASILFFRLPGENAVPPRVHYYWACVALEATAFMLQVVAKPYALYGPEVALAIAALQGGTSGIIFCNTYWRIGKKSLPPAVYTAVRDGRRAGCLGSVDDHGAEAAEASRNPVLHTTQDDEQPQESSSLLMKHGRSDSGVSGVDEVDDVALREFLLATIAPPDVFATLIASVAGMGVQSALCATQSCP